MSYGPKIARLAEARRLSDRDIARAMGGISPSTVGRWKSEQSEPKLRDCARLARILGTTVDFLADDATDEPPAPELSEDERVVIKVMRAQGLSADRVLAALANQPYRPKPGPMAVSGPVVEVPFADDLDADAPIPPRTRKPSRPNHR